ncbi:MAG: hypothetical protein LBQ88_10320 [Treponema sp.]|jgi:uncharacterized protein YozE (UPF0346 family)|nr:hypothetical protein [Treponema sp.]
MEEEKRETIKTLPWYDDTLTIKTNHTGIDGLTAEFNGNGTRLITFLNQFLAFEHENHIETILAKYEKKLSTVDITSLGAPVITENYLSIDRHAYAAPDFPAEEDMVTAILSEYLDHITKYEESFAKWDEIFNQWYQNYINH